MNDTEPIPFKYKPLPDIPRLPEEPALDGPPKGLQDTALFSSGKPYAWNTILDYESQLKSADKKAVALRFAEGLASNPDRFLEAITTLDKVEITHPDKHTKTIADIRADLEENLERVSHQLPTPYEKQVGGFMKISVENLEHKEMAEKVLRGYVLGRKTQAQIVDLAYNMCLYALKSQNPEIEEYTARILAYDTEILKIADNQAADLTTAAISDDKDILAKFLAVDRTTYLLRQIHVPGLHPIFEQALNQLTASQAFMQYYMGLKNDPSKRPFWNAIQAHYEYEVSHPLFAQDKPEYIRIAKELDSDNEVSNLLFRDDPLLRLYWNKLDQFFQNNEKGNIQVIQIVMPDGTIRPCKLIITAESIATGEEVDEKTAIFETLRAIYYEKSQTVTNAEAIVYALTHLKPPNFEEKDALKLEELRLKYKRDLWDKVSCSLSPHGDLVMVEDETLKASGLPQILFEFGEVDHRDKQGQIKTVRTANETKITLALGKCQVVLTLDKHHTLKGLNRKDLILDKATKVWWETILLAYLRDLTCENESQNLVIPEDIKHLKGQEYHVKKGELYTSRKAHRRKLPQGQSFTEEQRKIILQELGIDLAKYNEDRNQTRQTGMYTWVKTIDEVKVGTRKPIKVRIPNATKQINQLLKKTEENKS